MNDDLLDANLMIKFNGTDSAKMPFDAEVFGMLNNLGGIV